MGPYWSWEGLLIVFPMKCLSPLMAVLPGLNSLILLGELTEVSISCGIALPDMFYVMILFFFKGRYSHSSVVLSDGSVLVMGGITTPGVGVRSNEVYKSSNGGLTWALLTSSAWPTGGKYFLIFLIISHSLIGSM